MNKFRMCQTLAIIILPILLQGQKIKTLEFKEVNALSRIQIQSLEMEPEDQDLILYDIDRETYMRYTGTMWMDIGDGGDFRSALIKNEENIEFRKTAVTKKLPRDTTKKYIPKFDKKVRQHLVLDNEDEGLIIYEKEFKIYNKGNWVKLGKGGNFGGMLNRQKSIVGLKEGFLTNWRRSYGFGLTGGLVYPSFFRDDLYPSNPLLKGLSFGWEIGISQNVVYKKYFQSKYYITYNHLLLTEVFRGYNGNDLTAEWLIRGPKVVMLPIIITPGSRNIKLALGVGAYGRYHVWKELTTDSTEPILTNPDDAFEPIEYGVQAQVGLQIYRFFLELNATNQVNTFIRSDWVELNQEITKLKLKTFSLNLSFNF